jgi:hypothetical protein
VLARAIARIGTAVATPSGALAIGGPASRLERSGPAGITATRVARLLAPPAPLPLTARVTALGSALALLLVPTALLLGG